MARTDPAAVRLVFAQWSGTTIALDATSIWLVAGSLSAATFAALGFLVSGVDGAVVACVVAVAVAAFGLSGVGRQESEVLRVVS